MVKSKNYNPVYKKVITNLLKQDKGAFCPFRKEQQMNELLAMLKPSLVKKGQRILEAGCGYGRLIYFLDKLAPEQNYIGVDYVPELIEMGKKKFAKQNNIEFLYLDFFNLPVKFTKYFDISLSYKTLSWLPDYRLALKQLIKATKKKIYITSLFYGGDIDFITKIYQDAKNNVTNFTYLNTYSLPKFKKYCLTLGVKNIKVQDLRLDIDLPRPRNSSQLQTYTELLADGQRLEITGNNILYWKLIELTL